MPEIPQYYFKTVSGSEVPYTQEVIVKAYEPLRPFPQNPSAIVYRARVQQLRAYYTRPAFNTPHPNLPQVYFADDVDFQDKTAGVIEWTRTWVTLPSSWDDYESYAYTYPGYTGVRVPFTKTVTAKIQHDYFLVGALPTFSAGFTQYDDFANAAWTKTSASATANAANVPVCAGGALTAAKVYEAAAAAQHYVSQSVAAGAGQLWGAVFLKEAGRSMAQIRLNDGGVIANATVDLSTGNMTQATGNWGTIAAIGEGWYRVGLSGVAANGTTALEVFLMNANSTNYLGDGTSGMYMWRGQLVAGGSLPYATVPPTTTADNTNYPINTAGHIPTKFGITYLYTWAANTAAEYLSGSTTPTLTNYQANVTIDQNAANSNIYSLEATDSQLGLWQGTVWGRDRTFVKAR